MLGISLLAEELLAFQEGYFFVDFKHESQCVQD